MVTKRGSTMPHQTAQAYRTNGDQFCDCVFIQCKCHVLPRIVGDINFQQIQQTNADLSKDKLKISKVN